MGAELMVTWSTREELLLGGAILRHGTRDWTVVAAELKKRTVSPCNFTPEVCKAKYEELQQWYSGCTSLELKLESLKAGRNEKTDNCRVDNGSVGQELQVPSQRLDRVKPSAKEMSKDGLSAGSFTHETQTNWSNECQVPATSCEDVETKPEVSGSTEQEKVLNVDKSAHTVYEGQGGSLKKRRGKRKRKDCGRNINEVSVRESDFSADVCKDSSTSNCGETVKSSGMNEENANMKKDGIKDLMEILDSVLVVQGASAFCRRLDSQKRGRYKKMIRQHMDFDTIRSRISNRTIKSAVELLRDLMLLTNNALAFYSKITREYKTALLLRDLVIKTLREKLKCLSSSVTLANTSSTSPVHDPAVKVRSMHPGNRKIVAKVAGGSSSAERVSLGAKKTNKVDSPPSVESLPIKKAFGRTKKVGRENAGQRHPTATPRKENKRGRAK
ncbi:bromodomain domain containing protein [Spatholobus suberectus]|nr:bromodomain domain containing protein [Spatholobus suberectus]